jgi:Holliday junction resolvase RusA-like endonuclease
MIRFVIPGKAKGKARPRRAKHGGVYTPKATKEAEAIIADQARKARAVTALIEGPVQVAITVLQSVPGSWP